MRDIQWIRVRDIQCVRVRDIQRIRVRDIQWVRVRDKLRDSESAIMRSGFSVSDARGRGVRDACVRMPWNASQRVIEAVLSL